VTDEGDSDGARFVIRFDGDKTLSPDDGWPVLPPPESGESPLAWMRRAESEDPFVQKILALGAVVGLKIPYLEPIRPAQITAAWHAKTWPEKRGEPVPDPASWWVFREDYRRLLGYELNRAVWRVRVAVCERLLAGDPPLRGRAGPAWSVEPVPLGLLRNKDMEMQCEDDALRPTQRPGSHPPPGDLSVFGELTLCPAATGDVQPSSPQAPQEPAPKTKTRRQLLADALVARHEGGRSILSPGTSVDDLHKEVGEATKIQISKTTFERALRDARNHILSG
jgi:hypothetical protein